MVSPPRSRFKIQIHYTIGSITLSYFLQFSGQSPDRCYFCFDQIESGMGVQHTSRYGRLVHPIHEECLIQMTRSGFTRCSICLEELDTENLILTESNDRFSSLIARFTILSGVISYRIPTFYPFAVLISSIANVVFFLYNNRSLPSQLFGRLFLPILVIVENFAVQENLHIFPILGFTATIIHRRYEYDTILRVAFLTQFFFTLAGALRLF